MKELRRVALATLSAFLLIALTAAYWSVIAAEGLLQREDNPRLVEAEAIIHRGRVYDRQGILLATTTVNYDGIGLRRLYPHPEVAPAVGYYSAQFGVSGIEATYDALLRGDEGPTLFEKWLRDLLHEPPVGGDVRLTLDLQVQRAAVQALGDYAGAIVVATIPDGAIRAMVSAPIFNPNVLDEDWHHLIQAPDAPLLNRVTQGVYQPGGLLETVLLGTAIAHRMDTEAPIPGGAMPVQVNGLTLDCGQPLPTENDPSLHEAYIHACPGAFTQITTDIRPAVIDQAFWRFGLLTPPDLLGLNTDIGDSPLPLAFLRDDEAIRAALAGQGALTVTPLQALEIVAAIANGGNAPLYHLVEATRLPTASEWQPVQPVGMPRAVLTRQTTEQLQTQMRSAAVEGIAADAQAQSIYPILGHAATAYSGPEATPLQWFIGMIRASDGSAVIIAVVVEGADSPTLAAQIGGQTLDAAARIYISQETAVPQITAP